MTPLRAARIIFSVGGDILRFLFHLLHYTKYTFCFHDCITYYTHAHAYTFVRYAQDLTENGRQISFLFFSLRLYNDQTTFPVHNILLTIVPSAAPRIIFVLLLICIQFNYVS